MVRQLIELVSRLRQRGMDVRLVLVVRAGMDYGPLREDLQSKRLSYEVVTERWAFDPALVRCILRITGQFQPDIVQTHGYKSAVLGRLAQTVHGVPWIAYYHGRTTTSRRVRAYHLLERWLMSGAAAIACVAPGVEEHLNLKDRARRYIIPNGAFSLAPASSSRAETRARFGFSDSQPVVGWVGRLSSEKGPDLFLQAMQIVHRDRPEVAGLLVGEGPMRGELEDALACNEVKIVLAGQMSDMAAAYSAMDIVAITSRSEVFPNVLLEAVESTRPVAATPTGGIPWIAGEGRTITVASDIEASSIAAVIHGSLSQTWSDEYLAEVRAGFRRRFSQARRAEAAESMYEAVFRKAGKPWK